MSEGLSGTSLAGGSVNYERVKDDFYATNPQSVLDFLIVADIDGKHFYEPCVGQGHIAKVIKDRYPDADVLGSDLVDRGYPDTLVFDYLKDDRIINTDWVITNPPYKHALKFIKKAITQSNKGVAMFLKIQFLEGQARKAWFADNPPRYVYVFSKRQDPWRDGEEVNPATGKKWGSTMCFAWYVWEKNFTGETVVRWI